MKKHFEVHPFIFGVFPILFLYLNNLEEVSFYQMIIPFSVMLLLIFLLQLFLSIFYKDKHKKGLVISLFLLFFFTYGAFHDSVYHLFGRKIASSLNDYLIYIWIAIFLILVFFINKKVNKHLNIITKYLNTVSIILFSLIFLNTGINDLQSYFSSSQNQFKFLNPKNIKFEHFDREKLPNIYYIISDGYGSSNILKREYGYDNSDFENFLKQNGFYIASNSRSNYAETMLSFASALNMEHINKLGANVRFPLLYNMIQDNNVMRFLKSIGYKTIDISSNIGKLQHIRAANFNETPGNFLADEFHSTIIETTMLKAFKKELNLVYFYRKKILNTFKDLGEVHLKYKSPFFVFVHILPPHPPYVFGPNAEPIFGSLNLKDWGEMWQQKNLYRDQVIFVNGMLKKVLHKILSESKNDPIIIIQGDHGPLLNNKNKIDTRMHIFNAIHLTKDKKNFIYSSITPVNTFRLIFNNYFHTNFKLLEDKSYYTEYKVPYNFVDVTDLVTQKKLK